MEKLSGSNLPLSARKKDSHKGDFGHVLLVGGGKGMLGAIGLAAMSTLRSGAGVVSIATIPEYAKGALVSLLPEAMVYGISQAEDLLPLIQRANICVLGPGLGESDWARSLFSYLMTTSLPLVMDASALGLLAQFPQKNNNWILTPHPGEASQLLAKTTAEVQADRPRSITDLQQQYGGVSLLKGANTLIQTPEGETFICPRGNPGMSSAGMGDILTGLIAGLLAQGLSMAEAAKIGVWVHATAGDYLAKKQGERGMLAHDLIPLFPLILNGFIS